MTRKEALAELIAKVEAGDIERAPFWKVWLPENPDGWLAWRAASASTGSLDAAKALHEAVLPGYAYGIIGTLSDGDCRACVVPKIDNPPEYHGRSGDPARAWLLSILKALMSEIENDA